MSDEKTNIHLYSMAYPINFSIPKEKICELNDAVKTKLLSSLIPGNVNTYVYNNEEAYYNEYRTSYFAITKLKGGWDCMRHYEILANGCIPYFIDIERCPPNTLTFLPKELILEGNRLYERIKHSNELNEEEIRTYNRLRTQLLEHTKRYLTTDKMAEYILQTASVRNATNILYLSGDVSPDYLRCLTLHGLKTLFGSRCHDYPKIPHLYKSNRIHYAGLYGKGITYTHLLDPTLHDETFDQTIVEDIQNKYYDVVIYGSYHRGMPYYDLVCNVYRPNEIILLCGEDLHSCNYDSFVKKGHSVFVREL
jgi:hypothetical protein